MRVIGARTAEAEATEEGPEDAGVRQDELQRVEGEGLDDDVVDEEVTRGGQRGADDVDDGAGVVDENAQLREDRPAKHAAWSALVVSITAQPWRCFNRGRRQGVQQCHHGQYLPGGTNAGYRQRVNRLDDDESYGEGPRKRGQGREAPRKTVKTSQMKKRRPMRRSSALSDGDVPSICAKLHPGNGGLQGQNICTNTRLWLNIAGRSQLASKIICKLCATKKGVAHSIDEAHQSRRSACLVWK